MRVAFYKSTRPGIQGVYSRLVRVVDKGSYSHCELVFTSGISASASYIDGGIRFKEIDYNPEHWDFLELPDSFEDKAFEWFQRHEGASYDLIGNIAFVIPGIKHSQRKWTCSESIAESLGIPQSWRYGPNGLYSTLLFGLQQRTNYEVSR